MLEFENGERVAALCSSRWGTSEETYTATPIGYKVPWELSDLDRRIIECQDLNLSTTDYYLHMEPIMTQEAYADAHWKELYYPHLGICAAVLLVVWVLLHLYWESGQPRNQLELWLAGTHALWGQQTASISGLERAGTSPWRFGGASKTPVGRLMIRHLCLKQGWDITDPQDLLETVEYMSEGDGLPDDEDKANLAWQLCRSSALLGMAYVLGWLSRKEMIRRTCVVGKLIQQHFDSWDDLYQNFLEAFALFKGESGSEVVQSRVDIYWTLKRRNPSPFVLPWDMKLEP